MMRATDAKCGAAAEARDSQLRGIIESAMDAIITTDCNGRIVLFNRAAELAFGCRAADVIGKSMDQLLPARFRTSHQMHMRAFALTAEADKRMGASRVVSALRANGEEFPIDASISRVQVGGEQFFTVILRDVSARVRAEQELEAARAEIRQLSLAAQTAREQEKARIARELHDELGQALTALKMDVAWLQNNFGSDPARLASRTLAMSALLDSTMAAVRRIAADLRPLILGDLGLEPALEWLVGDFSRRHGIACSLQVAADCADLAEPIASALYRIAQEGLTNVARHACATKAGVHIYKEGGKVMLSLQDNGRGFAADSPPGKGAYGIKGIRERVYLLGGQVNFLSRPGQGTVIRVTLPPPPTGAREAS
jgi:PAS domain S-box-containing protein